MLLREGDVLYEAYTNDDGKVIVAEWHLRTVRNRKGTYTRTETTYGYITQKVDGVTWVKTGHGARATWSWAERTPAYYRKKFRMDAGPGKDFAKSKRQALRLALRKFEGYVTEDPTDEWHVKSRDALKRALSRAK